MVVHNAVFKVSVDGECSPADNRCSLLPDLALLLRRTWPGCIAQAPLLSKDHGTNTRIINHSAISQTRQMVTRCCNGTPVTAIRNLKTTASTSTPAAFTSASTSSTAGGCANRASGARNR